MMGIDSNTVQYAIGAELEKAFPNITRYRESSTTPIFPHFFVEILSQSARQDRWGKWWLDYLVTIRYRVASDLSKEKAIHTKLDVVGLQLLCSLESIKIGNGNDGAWLTDTYYKKIDGVLHYFCKVRIQCTKSQEKTRTVAGLTQNISKRG